MDAEDAVQETAIKILDRTIPFRDAADLFRWAVVVAWRQSVDIHRTAVRRETTVLSDEPSTEDLPLTVEYREALRRIAAGWAQLTPRERASIGAADMPTPSDRRAAVRQAVQRHRARARLIAMTDGLLALLAWLWRCLRSPTRRALLTTACGIAITAFALGVATLTLRHEGRKPISAPTSRLTSHRALHGKETSASNGSKLGSSKPPSRPGKPPGAEERLDRQLPEVGITINPGIGKPGGFSTRPSRPDDPMVCVGPLLTGTRCVNYPPGAKALWKHVLG